MRVFELYGTDFKALGLYNPENDRLSERPQWAANARKITLRDLNRLKHVRNRRREEARKHSNLVRTMYGNPDLRDLDLQQQEQRLETLRGQIALEIDAAEIDQGQKERIRDMARNAMRKSKK